jgi:hypothetical protein
MHLPRKQTHFCIFLLLHDLVVSSCVRHFFMMDEDEDDYSYVALALHRNETDPPEHTQRIILLPSVREIVCSPVVLFDISHCSGICEQASSLSHPEVDETQFFNLLVRPTAHPLSVTAGLR